MVCRCTATHGGGSAQALHHMRLGLWSWSDCVLTDIGTLERAWLCEHAPAAPLIHLPDVSWCSTYRCRTCRR
jgi:hypothetical protein